MACQNLMLKNFWKEQKIKHFPVLLNESIKALSVKKTGNYKIDITLDNGQVWRSVESVYNRLPVKKSQKVIISKALVSGHILKVTGKKVAIRVRKIS